MYIRKYKICKKWVLISLVALLLSATKGQKAFSARISAVRYPREARTGCDCRSLSDVISFQQSHPCAQHVGACAFMDATHIRDERETKTAQSSLFV